MKKTIAMKRIGRDPFTKDVLCLIIEDEKTGASMFLDGVDVENLISTMRASECGFETTAAVERLVEVRKIIDKLKFDARRISGMGIRGTKDNPYGEEGKFMASDILRIATDMSDATDFKIEVKS